MADKKKVIGLEVNTGNSENDLAKLGSGFKKVNKEATDLEATFEDINGDIKPLTGRMGELEDRLYELANAGKTGTKEFKDLANEIGRLRKVQQETDKTTDALAMTTSQKLGGSMTFAAGTMQTTVGALAAFGIKSEGAEKAIAGLVGAMAVTDGIETMNESFKSVRALGRSIKSTTVFQKALNLAMKMSPIGMLVAGITALVGLGAAVYSFFSEGTNEVEIQNEALDRQIEKLNEVEKFYSKENARAKKRFKNTMDLLKAEGKGKEELREAEKKGLNELLEINKNQVTQAEEQLREANKKASKIRQEGESDERKAAEVKVKKFKDSLAKRIEAVSQTLDTIDDLETKYRIEDAQADTNAREAKKNNTSKGNKEEVDTNELKNDAILKQQDDFYKDLEDKAEDRAQRNKEGDDYANAEKLRDSKEAFDAGILRAEEEKAILLERAKDDEEAELEAIRIFNQRKRDLEAEHNAIVDEVDNTRKLQKQEKDAEQREKESEDYAAFLQEDAAKRAIELQIAEQQAQAKMEIEDAYISHLQGVSGMLGAMAGENEALAQAALIIEKGAAIAGVVIETQRSIAQKTAAANAIPAFLGMGIPNPSYILAQADAVKANTMTKVSAGLSIATIAATAIKGGSKKTSGASGGASGAGAGRGKAPTPANMSLGNFQDSSFDALGNEQTQVDRQANANAQANSDRPIQTFVTTGEVATGNALERNRVNVSGF